MASLFPLNFMNVIFTSPLFYIEGYAKSILDCYVAFMQPTITQWQGAILNEYISAIK